MNNTELKTIWKLSKLCYLSFFILWISETLIFLLIEGWHIKATNPIEIFLDKSSIYILDIGLFTTWFFFMNAGINLIRNK